MKNEYSIIGKPIAHSLSPIMHNYWFKKYNIKANYTLLEIDENKIEEITQKVRKGIIKGINITLPYKQKIIPYLDKIINDAKETKSVNTIYMNDKSELVGENTDVYGLQAGYLNKISDSNFLNKKALVIGAGGVAPSAILALEKSNLREISIINRTYDKSLFLKKRFTKLKVYKWNQLEENIQKSDIVINATSLGLKNGEDFDIKLNNLKKELIYIDTIYNPFETNMIKYFKKAGIQKTFNGLEMFIYQGQKSFYLWTKINPEIDNNLINLLKTKL
ncbi:MAG: shikimate dehydrogenase [Pelagibacteraceae bacterium]